MRTHRKCNLKAEYYIPESNRPIEVVDWNHLREEW